MEVKFEKVSYNDNSTKILKNLNFILKSNCINVFMGPCGSGKSTILELISILKFPSSGKIMIGDYNINESTKDVYKLSPMIGIAYQNPEKQFFLETVKEELEFALKNYKYKSADLKKRVHDSLKMVGLNDSYLNRHPFELSFGEQKKLSLAIVLAFNPKIILLDEPTIGLDMKSREYLIKLLKMMKNRYKKTIIIVSNDSDFVHRIADEIYIVNKGKIIQTGDKYTIFSNYELLKKYDIEMPKIMKFSYLVKEKKGIDIGFRDDINDLIKDVYRYVK